MQDRNN